MLLEQLRQDAGRDAVMLISRRGLVVSLGGRPARQQHGSLADLGPDRALHAAGLKVAESNRQESPDHFSVFSGGDQDLILMPVDPGLRDRCWPEEHSPTPDALPPILQGDAGGHGQSCDRGLRELAAAASAAARAVRCAKRSLPSSATSRRCCNPAEGAGISEDDMDAYWEAAAAQHGNKPISKDVIPYEEARKLGLTPDADEK